MLETKQLQYFVVSADCGSFREAAKILYTTQSNVSKVIAGLESQVGYPLSAHAVINFLMLRRAVKHMSVS